MSTLNNLKCIMGIRELTEYLTEGEKLYERGLQEPLKWCSRDGELSLGESDVYDDI
jgi:hypothetical protein